MQKPVSAVFMGGRFDESAALLLKLYHWLCYVGAVVASAPERSVAAVAPRGSGASAVSSRHVRRLRPQKVTLMQTSAKAGSRTAMKTKTRIVVTQTESTGAASASGTFMALGPL